MKSLLFVFSVLFMAVLVHCELPKELKKTFEECRTELGLPDEKKGLPNLDDPKLKCFHACVMLKKGAMTDDKVLPEKVIELHMKHFPNLDDSAKDAITECANTANQQGDKCEAAGAFGQCMKKIYEKLRPPSK